MATQYTRESYLRIVVFTQIRRMTGGVAEPGRSVPPCSLPGEGVEFVNDAGGIAVPFAGRHGAEQTAFGSEHDDADHEAAREVPSIGLNGFERLGHCGLLSFVAGAIPARQAPEVSGAWPQSPHRRSLKAARKA